MKNPTLLKDELRLLSQDKSELVKELDKVGNELKKTNSILVDTDGKLRVAKSELALSVASNNYIASQYAQKEDELREIQLEIQNHRAKFNEQKVLASQEVNLLTGKIKELKGIVEEIKSNIDLLKQTYDSNSKTYRDHLTERNNTLRKLDIDIEDKGERISKLAKEIKEKEEQIKKQDADMFTRDTLQLEKEQTLDLLVKSNEIKQQDLTNASRDLIIVYQRLKELYAIVDPKLDVDRLFNKLLSQ